MSGNREYKSDVFSMLLADKKNALQLYNALNESQYTDPELIEMKTLDSGISLTVRNDAAFVLDSNPSIYEHQSSVCPNMPIRCLIYFTNIIEKMVNKRNLYGKSLVRIPTPHFVIFYNGEQEQPEQYDLSLSDAYAHTVDNPELEVTCRVYNINHGKNKALLDACPVLREYMIFVDYVREYHAQNEYDKLELAINLAIDRCILEGVLKEFLLKHRSEVVKVTQMDYTFDRQIELEREEARESGLAEGRAKGRAEGRAEGREAQLLAQIRKKMEKGKQIEVIADELEETIETIQQLYERVQTELGNK